MREDKKQSKSKNLKKALMQGILLQFGAFYTIMDLTFFRESNT